MVLFLLLTRLIFPSIIKSTALQWGSRGVHRFQLKHTFRSLIGLTYSSIPVSLNDTAYKRGDHYGQVLLYTADSANIQWLGPSTIKYCRADRVAYFLLVGMESKPL